jgi:phosphoribosylamine--glycine ligase
MANFLIYSDCGDGAFLALRLLREGHQVKLYIKAPNAKDVYRGIVERVNSPHPKVGDVVIFDMVGMGKVADNMRKYGMATIGACAYADKLELDRKAGHDLMKSCGIKTPETVFCKTIPEAIAFLRGQEGEWFYKPSGNEDAGQTYGGDVKDVLRFLDFSATRHKPIGIELQRKIEGTEISIEGWFDGERFIYPFNSTFEDKKFMVGDNGPRTGCMANVVWGYDAPQPILALKTLCRLESVLARMNFRGPIDLNCIVDKEGVPHGLEWSPRLGYDAIQALSLLIAGDFGQQLAEFAVGKLPAFAVRDGFGMTLNVSMPPYPNTQGADKLKGFPLDPEVWRQANHGVMLTDVMLNTQGKLTMAGADGRVAVMGVHGNHLSTMRYELLDFVSRFKIPNAQYRVDPVIRAEKGLAELAKHLYEVPNELPQIPEDGRSVGGM